jgi:rod shape-determining protein MreD
MVGRPEPSPGLLRRLDDVARAALPALVTAFLMIIAAGPTGVPALVPAVALPSVVFWSMARPGAMSPPAVFLLGLLQDLLTLAPLGSGIVTLLAAHGLAATWRRSLSRVGFLLGWLAFSGFAAGAAGLGLLLTAVLNWTLPSAAPALQQALLTAGIYPAFALVLSRLHLLMLRAEETT